MRDLAAQSDILLENFKVGGLARYGLDYASLAALNPRLIHCSITGFGETGPYADRPGYDFLIQGMGGLMSITGEPDDVEGGGPQKVGVALADVMSWPVRGHRRARRAAPRASAAGAGPAHRHRRCSMSQVAWLAEPGHELSAFPASAGTPRQRAPGHRSLPGLRVRRRSLRRWPSATTTSSAVCAPSSTCRKSPTTSVSGPTARVEHREELIADPADRVRAEAEGAAGWESLEAAGIPCGPINRIDEVFADPQVQARGMQVDAPHPLAGTVPLVGSPLKMSATRTARGRGAADARPAHCRGAGRCSWTWTPRPSTACTNPA
ncbi:MAG: CaiB/BaiF CoA-transferase family protein [Halofilum sp. (in: g-proteobacteria)]|nr:CaiB/BaiF CoA-transferase family protein [Halofilum sp. (in: g-proteobacteria)]